MHLHHSPQLHRADNQERAKKNEQMDKVAITNVTISREGRGSRHHHEGTLVGTSKINRQHISIRSLEIKVNSECKNRINTKGKDPRRLES